MNQNSSSSEVNHLKRKDSLNNGHLIIAESTVQKPKKKKHHNKICRSYSKSTFLSDVENEVAWLAEESHFLNPTNQEIDWDFVKEFASSKLSELLNKGTARSFDSRLLPRLVRFHNPYIKDEFNRLRLQVGWDLKSGIRREKTLSALPEPDEHCDYMNRADLKPLPKQINATMAEINKACNLRMGSSNELSKIEKEMARLIEESESFNSQKHIDWDYVRKNSSNELAEFLDEVISTKGILKLDRVVRVRNSSIKTLFEKERSRIRNRMSLKNPKKIDQKKNKMKLDFHKFDYHPFVLSSLIGKMGDFEIEMAILIEESMFYLKKESMCWIFIYQFASSPLKQELEKKHIDSNGDKNVNQIVRKTTMKRFEQLREEIRDKLHGGSQRSFYEPLAALGLNGLDNSFVTKPMCNSSTEDQLLPIEKEIAWLSEANQLTSGQTQYDWEFINLHASDLLKECIQQKCSLKVNDSHDETLKLKLMVRWDNIDIRKSFLKQREAYREVIKLNMKKYNSIAIIKAIEEQNHVQDIFMKNVTIQISLEKRFGTKYPLNSVELEIIYLQQASRGQTGQLQFLFVKKHASKRLRKTIQENAIISMNSLVRKAVRIFNPEVRFEYLIKQREVIMKLNTWRKNNRVFNLEVKPTNKRRKILGNSFHFCKKYCVNMNYGDLSKVSKRGDKVYLVESLSGNNRKYLSGTILGSRVCLTIAKEEIIIYSVMLDDSFIDNNVDMKYIHISQT